MMNMNDISNSKIMEKIIDKFLCIFKCKETKIMVLKIEDTYHILHNGYELSIKEDNKNCDYMYITFKYGEWKILFYNFTRTENEHLYSKVYNELLVCCDEELQYNKKMKIIQNFLDND